MKHAWVVTCLLPIICIAAEGNPEDTPDTPEAPAPVSRWGARDVEVTLTDNSTFRGELDGVDSVLLKTAYGLLTIPCNEILRVQRAPRVEAKAMTDVAASIKDLDHDEFAKRAAAQKALEGAPLAAIEPLKKAREGASPEARTRIEKILAKLNEKANGKAIQTEDIVRTVRFDAAGVLQLDALKLSSRVGKLAIKGDDLYAIRWLNRGDFKALSLAPTAAIGEWVDTGLTLNPGERVAVVVSGTINPSPNNNNLEISPTGTENWGNNGGYLMGALLGKIGDGETFVIGQGKSWVASTKDRLFVKIFWNQRQVRVEAGAKGAYKLRITTGTLAEETKMPKNGDEESHGDAVRNPF